ncbi:hypothetical protein NCS13_1_1521 [Neochlamydia sp. S13]|nr:hypothetical protein NCS13_1_1521 [Neochlamydia sp. S13]
MDISDEFLNKKAGYIVENKGNQIYFKAEAYNFFGQAKAVNYQGVKGMTREETHEKNHGHIESRYVRSQCIGMVSSTGEMAFAFNDNKVFKRLIKRGKNTSGGFSML